MGYVKTNLVATPVKYEPANEGLSGLFEDTPIMKQKLLKPRTYHAIHSDDGNLGVTIVPYRDISGVELPSGENVGAKVLAGFRPAVLVRTRDSYEIQFLYGPENEIFRAILSPSGDTLSWNELKSQDIPLPSSPPKFILDDRLNPVQSVPLGSSMLQDVMDYVFSDPVAKALMDAAGIDTEKQIEPSQYYDIIVNFAKKKQGQNRVCFLPEK